MVKRIQAGSKEASKVEGAFETLKSMGTGESRQLLLLGELQGVGDFDCLGVAHLGERSWIDKMKDEAGEDVIPSFPEPDTDVPVFEYLADVRFCQQHMEYFWWVADLTKLNDGDDPASDGVVTLWKPSAKIVSDLLEIQSANSKFKDYSFAGRILNVSKPNKTTFSLQMLDVEPIPVEDIQYRAPRPIDSFFAQAESLETFAEYVNSMKSDFCERYGLEEEDYPFTPEHTVKPDFF